MKHVHITLVGEQPIPVYNVINHLTPDEVVLIHSASTKDIAQRIVKQLGIESTSKYIELDPTNGKDIQYCAETLFDDYFDDNISLNLTSGTKHWSIIFTREASKYQGIQLYLIDQNNLLFNLSDFTSATVDDIDFDVRFSLLRGQADSYKLLSEYTEEDKKVCKELELCRKYNFDDFKSLMSKLNDKRSNILNNNKSGRFDLKLMTSDSSAPYSFVEWCKADKSNPMDKVDITLVKNGKPQKFSFSSPNAISLAFNSGWFEFKVAQLISPWSKVKEIYMNSIFKVANGKIKNEVDIIVNTGKKAIFVECKTQVFNNTDVDKFVSVVKNYGGLGSKAIFVTEAKMEKVSKEKCDEHKVETFAIYDGKLNLSVVKELHHKLDAMYNSINTK
ncbi:MAG: DUF1887 family CARF protein [bacterium]